jgi:hypothetical protein
VGEEGNKNNIKKREEQKIREGRIKGKEKEKENVKKEDK